MQIANEGREKVFIFNTAAISGKRKKDQIFWKKQEIISDLKVVCGRSILSENSVSVGMYANMAADQVVAMEGEIGVTLFEN